MSSPKQEKELYHIIPDGMVEIKIEDEPPRFLIIKENISYKEFMSSRPSTSSIMPESHPNLNEQTL